MLNKFYWVVGLLICAWFATAAYGQWKTPEFKTSSGSSSGRGTYYGGGGWFGGK